MFELFVAEIARAQVEARELDAPVTIPDCVPQEWTDDAVRYALAPGPPFPKAA